jgi:glycosyltransferase involved in cell wall biosynthesis
VTKEEKISIIMPAYNEASAIGDTLDKLMPMASEFGWRVIVVDDGSNDNTCDVAKKHGVEVLTHPYNQGYGASLSTGIRSTDTDIVVFIDSDGQHNPNDIIRLLKYSDQYDMVVGTRTKDSHVDLRRRPGKRILKWFADYMAKEKIPDINSGFRIFRHDVISSYLHLMPKGFSFSTTSTFAMIKGGHKIKWIPIQTSKRVGTSTVKQLKHGPEVIMLMLRLTVLFDPLRVFLPISGFLMLSAAIITIINFVMYRMAIPSSAVFLGISSVIIFMLGLLTDQVSAIRRELHKHT